MPPAPNRQNQQDLNPLMQFPYNVDNGDPYDYVATLALAQNANGTTSVAIDAGYVFKWTHLTGALFLSTGATALIGTETTLQITDGRSSHNFFDSPIPLDLILGVGKAFSNQFILPVPCFFDPSSNIIVTCVMGPLGAGTFNLAINFGGIKIPLFNGQ